MSNARLQRATAAAEARRHLTDPISVVYALINSLD
jgi:hypothetical protein